MLNKFLLLCFALLFAFSPVQAAWVRDESINEKIDVYYQYIRRGKTFANFITFLNANLDKKYEAVFTNTVTLAADAEIPTNCVTWRFEPEGLITGNYTITFSGNELVGPKKQQMFGYSTSATGNVSNFEIYPEMFGAKNDGATDDADAFQAAANLAYNSNGKTVKLSTGLGYKLFRTIFVPLRVNIIGSLGTISPRDVLQEKSMLVSDTAGTYTSDYMLMFNTTDAITWDISYPNIDSGLIERVGFFNDGVSTLNAVVFAGSYTFRLLFFDSFNISLYKTENYSDKIIIQQVDVVRTKGTDYPIQFSQLGDGMIIEQLHFHELDLYGNEYGLSLIGSFGGVVQGLIGGLTFVDRCDGVTISNYHGENRIDDNPDFIFRNSNIILKDSYFWGDKTGTVNVKIESSELSSCVVALENVRFAYELSLTEDPQYFQISLEDNTTALSIKDCYRVVNRSGGIGLRQIGGILVESSGFALDNFNDFSFLNSINSFTVNGSVMRDYVMFSERGPIYNFQSIATSNLVDWELPSDTYYYELQYINEPNRMIGRQDDSGGKGIALTSSGDGAIITLGSNKYARTTNLRVYRGLSTPNYNAVVDIPLVNTRQLYDNGNHLNGYAWESRATADVDATTTTIEVIKVNESNFVGYTSLDAAPATTNFVAGDILVLTDVSTGNQTVTNNTDVEYRKTGWIFTGTNWMENRVLTGN